MKAMTRGEAETKRRKAIEFLRRIGNVDQALPGARPVSPAALQHDRVVVEHSALR